jgi:hypothetical protein
MLRPENKYVKYDDISKYLESTFYTRLHLDMHCRLFVICDTYELYSLLGKHFTVFVIFQHIK